MVQKEDHTLQWEMSKSSQPPLVEATYLQLSHSIYGLGGMDSLLMLVLQHPKAQHRLPPAPAGGLHDWPLSRSSSLCLDMKASELQGHQLTSCPAASLLRRAHNPQLRSVLAFCRSSDSQCIFKVLGRLWPAYLKAWLKFWLVRLSLKRTPLFFKSKFFVSVGGRSSLGTGLRLRNAHLQEQGVAANLTTRCAEWCVCGFDLTFFLW